MTWLLALVLTVAGLGGLEWWWRSQGYVPSVEDDMALWSYQRQRASRSGGKTLVLAGASEMQTAFSTGTFRRRFPDYQVVQLAVPGSNPKSMLLDLAQDDRFRGIVLCAMNERRLVGAVAEDEQVQYIRYYHQQSTLNTRLNRLLGAFLEDKLVALNSSLSLKNLLHTYRNTGHLPRPMARVTRLDRSRCVDYSRTDMNAVRRNRDRQMTRLGQSLEKLSYTPEQWLDEAMKIEPAIQQIESRGGRVVFLRFPSNAEGESLVEKALPRAQHWDVYARHTTATVIHYRDVPTLVGIDLPDFAHLDYRDAPRFTDAVLNELVKRKVFDSAVDVKTVKLR